MKILDVLWFCGRKSCGIAKVRTYDGNIKFYISAVDGYDEQVDAQFIADWGNTFPYEAGVLLMGE